MKSLKAYFHPKAAAIIIGALLFYTPLLFAFFWSDDWYILALADISQISEFFKFFSFHMNEYVTPVYRPLSSQVFYLVMRSIFGLEPFGFHFVAFGVWAAGACMLYRFLKSLFKDTHSPYIGLIFYVFSASHFTRLTYLSAFQEILLFFLAMTVLLVVQKNTWQRHVIALGAFIAALASKETAVVIPALIVLVEWYKARKWSDLLRPAFLKKYLPYFLILVVYIYLRFVVRGVESAGEEYAWDFSPLRALHTSMWYGLWGIGLPEFIIDYVGSGGRIIARYWTDFGVMAYVLLFGFLALIGTVFAAAVAWLRKGASSGMLVKGTTYRLLLLGTAWFLVALSPMLFLPGHKFALGQSLALVGLSLVFIELLRSASKQIQVLTIGVFVIFNLLSISMYYGNHVSMYRSVVSWKVYSYVVPIYPEPPAGFVFINDKDVTIQEWGLSLQIHQALSDHFMTVLYGKGNEPGVLYEDEDVIPDPLPEGWIELESSRFLP